MNKAWVKVVCLLGAFVLGACGNAAQGTTKAATEARLQMKEEGGQYNSTVYIIKDKVSGCEFLYTIYSTPTGASSTTTPIGICDYKGGQQQ